MYVKEVVNDVGKRSTQKYDLLVMRILTGHIHRAVLYLGSSNDSQKLLSLTV